METARKRIIDFIENQHIKPSDFLKKTGLKKGFIDRSHQNSGATDLYLSKILEVYPEISPEWLLTGNGSMLKEVELSTATELIKTVEELKKKQESYIEEAVIFDNTQEPEILTNSHGNKFFIYPDGTIRIEVAKVPFPAFASYIESYYDEIVINEEFAKISFKVDHIGKGYYLGFTNQGDSMNGGGINDTPGGSDILGREVGRHLWQNGFHKTKYGFVIITKNGMFHKDIDGIDMEKGNIQLSSRNPNDKPFSYPINEVVQIFHVIKRSF